MLLLIEVDGIKIKLKIRKNNMLLCFIYLFNLGELIFPKGTKNIKHKVNFLALSQSHYKIL